MNEQFRLGAVNSINWARILAQITYFVHSYFSLVRQTGEEKPTVRFVVPTGNFGDILAGYFATRMGLPTDKLVIATNENDILHRFWKTGHYEKKPKHGAEAEGGLDADGAQADPSGVKMTYAPAMDILVSSNFERLLWYLAFQTNGTEEVNRRRMETGEKVKGWLEALKTEGGFGVSQEILDAAKATFESERVSDKQTIDTIKDVYGWSLPKSATANGATNGNSKPPTTGMVHDGHYILDPHSAIGVNAALRSVNASEKVHHVSLATAHPAKFSNAVELALTEVPDFTFETVLPEQFVGLDKLPKRITESKNDWKAVREIVIRQVEEEKTVQR